MAIENMNKEAIFRSLRSLHPGDAEIGKLYMGASKFKATGQKRFTTYIGVKLDPVDCGGTMFDSFLSIEGRTARYRLCLSEEFDSPDSFVFDMNDLNPVEAFDLFYWFMNKLESGSAEMHARLKWTAEKRFREQQAQESETVGAVNETSNK